jgi:hypothetical protein
MLAFIAVVAWAWSRSAAKTFDRAAQAAARGRRARAVRDHANQFEPRRRNREAS